MFEEDEMDAKIGNIQKEWRQQECEPQMKANDFHKREDVPKEDMRGYLVKQIEQI